LQKEILLKLKSHIEPHTLIVGDLNTPLSSMNRASKHKINREIVKLTDTLKQMDITGIYRTFHPNTEEYPFFSSIRRTFSKIDYIVGYKTSLKRYKKIEITPYIL
jgi:exonuclease III